jgi:hypothetical protein
MPKLMQKTSPIARQKEKQAQQAMGNIVKVMEGSAEYIPRDPKRLVLTSNTQITKSKPRP